MASEASLHWRRVEASGVTAEVQEKVSEARRGIGGASRRLGVVFWWRWLRPGVADDGRGRRRSGGGGCTGACGEGSVGAEKKLR